MKFVNAGLLIAAALLMACEQGGSAGQDIAVVDLNEIAKATGQEEAIRSEVEGLSAQLTEELRGLLTNMESQLQTEREKLGTNPVAEDVQRIQALTMQAQQQITQANAEANRQVAMLESDLAEEFRDKLLPLARKEATQRGATVVLAKDAYLVWADNAVDITAAVITAWDNLPEEQKAMGSAAEAAPAEPAATSLPAEAVSPDAAASESVEAATSAETETTD